MQTCSPAISAGPVSVQLEWFDPALLYRRIAAKTDYAVWLDAGPENSGFSAKYPISYIAYAPDFTAWHDGSAMVVTAQDGTGHRAQDETPFTFLRKFYASAVPPVAPAQGFTGGLVGWIAFEAYKFIDPFQKIKHHSLDSPYCWFGLYRRVIAIDPQKRSMRLIIHPPRPDCGYIPDPPRIDPETELARINSLMEPGGDKTAATIEPRAENTGFVSNFGETGFLRAVGLVQDYIRAGDVYQVNIAQKFTANSSADPLDAYLESRAANPAGFGAYIDTGRFGRVLGFSPELFLKTTGSRAITRPIKGTIPSAEPAGKLAESEKDRAENVMIVDLMRNDFARVCRLGSVKVDSLCEIESHPSVHHLVSQVSGEIPPDKNPADLLEACFPGGSVTGAPKKRALEIIAELEPDPRGVYCGALGYFDFSGDMLLNIPIRTVTHEPAKYSIHAGGGITADSNALSEYAETLAKTSIIRKIIGTVTDNNND